MKIYIGARFEARYELREYAEKLWNHGFEIVSSWLNEVARPPGMPTEIFWKKLAIKDLAEIRAADVMILDTQIVDDRGGREAEWGFALGQHQRMQIFIVGPGRSVFHTLADRRFDSWDECLDFMTKTYTNDPLPTT